MNNKIEKLLINKLSREKEKEMLKNLKFFFLLNKNRNKYI